MPPVADCWSIQVQFVARPTVPSPQKGPWFPSRNTLGAPDLAHDATDPSSRNYRPPGKKNRLGGEPAAPDQALGLSLESCRRWRVQGLHCRMRWRRPGGLGCLTLASASKWCRVSRSRSKERKHPGLDSRCRPRGRLVLVDRSRRFGHSFKCVRSVLIVVALLAQLVEHPTLNRQVRGSSPWRGTLWTRRGLRLALVHREA